jgi:periplasmic protein TonB
MFTDRRAPAAIASVALHAIALALLVLWPDPSATEQHREVLTTIAFPPPPPEPSPPPEFAPAEALRAIADAGAGGMRAAPAPNFAAAIPMEMPFITPFAEPADAYDSLGGAESMGVGPGAGEAGGGSGGGGSGGFKPSPHGGSPPIRTAGAIRDSDYPRKAGKDGQHGRVGTEIQVDANGRPSACVILRSSGSAELDQATCRLIMRRFRYTPARDAQGRAMTGTATYDQQWVHRRADGA